MGRKRKGNICIIGKFKILYNFAFFLIISLFYLLFLVWEGNGKEILCTVGMGRKWEGNVVYCLSGKEMGRKC